MWGFWRWSGEPLGAGCRLTLNPALTAGGFGFSYGTEVEIPSGGRVDIVLTRAKTTVACEISATTSADHELGNLLKCLEAGYSSVVSICDHAGRREKIQELLREAAPVEQAGKVLFFTTRQFLTHLQEMATGGSGAASSPMGDKTSISLASPMTPTQVEDESRAMLEQLKLKLGRKK